LFYQIPNNEGKFDNRKAFHNGELLSLAKIPDDDNEEVAGKDEAAEE